MRFSLIVEQVLTVVCKLQPTPEQASKIDALLKAFADACNWANQTVKAGITSKTTIQNLVYQQLRKQFGLSANQAVRVCGRVGANRKTAKLKGKSVKALTSIGDKWDGKQIQDVRDKFAKVRTSLQTKASKGTRSTRRRARQILQRLSGRERRYQTWLNHNISKLIVLSALPHNAIIAIEDLRAIRERTNEMPRNKTERRNSSSWAFFQLRMFLSYKSVKYGVKVAAVNPAYTSQTCHNCLHIHPVKGKSYRSAKAFKCGHCGNHCDRDENGSKMISIVAAVFVNPLRGSVLSCDIADHIRATESPRFLAVG